MNKLFKRIAVFLCFVLITPAILNCIPSIHNLSQVEAAAKAKLYTTKGNIGIASSPEYLYVENQKDKAKYTYTSKNKKIATVDKYGKIIGVSKGKTDIVVKETYKGKTITVGTFKVTVLNSKLAYTNVDVSAYDQSLPPIQYMNFKAKYDLASADPTIVTIDKDGRFVGIKTGTTTISVSESYKNVTRKLGTFTVNVKEPTISANSKAIDIGINSSNIPSSIINIDNASWYTNFIYESADSSKVLVTTELNDWNESVAVIKGVALGTTQITVYTEYEGQKIEIGKVDVTVKEIPVTEFKVDPEFVDEELGYFSKTYYLGDDEYASKLTNYLVMNPVNATTPITFTSSDEKVVKVDKDGKVTTISAGTAMITATCGSYSNKMQIVVVNYDE